MRNPEYYKGKNVTVIGLARSGLACALLLHRLGARVSVTDNLDQASTRKNAAQLESMGMQVELGTHSEGFIQGRDLVVLSPGVPQEALPLVWARKYRIPVVSEVELAWSLCPAGVIAITGSVGKTTVTTLIGKIIQESGRKAFACGNIGNPFCGIVSEVCPQDMVVLEISSFQLETITTFKPAIAVFLNFSRNHLDRYKGMQEYLDAKKRIFMNQDVTCYLVLNKRDPVVAACAQEAKSKVVFFQAQEGINPNHAAVMAVGKLVGIEAPLIKRVCQEFKGVEHRMEHVAEIRGVSFINDSKATTAESTLWALSLISHPVVLIAGGKDKGIDYRVILEAAKGKVKKAILIGEAKQLIRSALGSAVPMEEAVTLEAAVHRAFMIASAGDCVLLSPMCASFDMFRDYEERGRIFKRIVHDLEKTAV